MHYRETRYGFEWGAAKVHRVASHQGYVAICITTPREVLHVRVTPSGLIRTDLTKSTKRSANPRSEQ